MQTTKSTVNTTTHLLDPQEVLAALKEYTRNGGFGPMADPNLDAVSAKYVENTQGVGVEITIVNKPPAITEGT